MRNVAPPVQFISVLAWLVNNTDTHRVAPPPPPPPPPPPKTDRPSHKVPGGAKNGK